MDGGGKESRRRAVRSQRSERGEEMRATSNFRAAVNCRSLVPFQNSFSFLFILLPSPNLSHGSRACARSLPSGVCRSLSLSRARSPFFSLTQVFSLVLFFLFSLPSSASSSSSSVLPSALLRFSFRLALQRFSFSTVFRFKRIFIVLMGVWSSLRIDLSLLEVSLVFSAFE